MSKNLLIIAALGVSSLYAGDFNPPASVNEAEEAYYSPANEHLTQAKVALLAIELSEAQKRLVAVLNKKEVTNRVRQHITAALNLIIFAQKARNDLGRNTAINGAVDAVDAAIAKL